MTSEGDFRVRALLYKLQVYGSPGVSNQID